ncbi:SDR family oxidoreductase [Leptospira idonii]|uniref:Aldehyde reductase n=1 Tax=Leptospira idonii TaxID=1193500 RepID=A0A4V3JYH6_9LEPT|nr:aldehyde reductase [Leptospira idonii]TGN20196.1 aldehyde reductase [Leptospira idonii]
MPEINRNKPILVTGGAGYIASWIIKFLLEDGFNVRATVRNKSEEKKIAHLTQLSQKHPGKLELYEADLMKQGSFLNAIRDCELILHTASPFFIDGIKNAQKELIEPAVNGTKNVLEAVNESPSVKRVVLTSSVAAVMGDNIDAKDSPGNRLNEESWNVTSSLTHQPYAYSKTLAEREAWRIHDAQSRWDLVTINPSFVLGPSVSDRGDGTSVNFMRSMVNGKFAPGVPDMMMGIVDVRDVAKAHIAAGLTPTAKGRHLTTAKTLSFVEVAKILKDHYGKKYKIPTSTIPKLVTYIIGPFFGLSWEHISKNVGVPFDLDNSYSIKDLGITYRPVSETLVEHIEQLAASKMV